MRLAWRPPSLCVFPVDPFDVVLVDVLSDGDADCRIETLVSNAFDQTEAAQPVLDRVLHLGECKLGVMSFELTVELGEHIGRRRVEVGDRFGGDHDQTDWNAVFPHC